MTPDEMADRLVERLRGSVSYDPVASPITDPIRSALARAHAEGKAEGLEEAAEGIESYAAGAQTERDFRTVAVATILAESIRARAKNIRALAPHLPAGEERGRGPDWRCPKCGGGYNAGRGLVCEGDEGACHPAASTNEHGTAAQPCVEARCSCGWAGTLPAPPPASAPAAGQKGEG